MKLLVALSCVLAACAGQVLVYPAQLLRYNHLTPVLAPISTQFRAQDELGQFTFATAGDNQGRVESKSLDGAVRGAYSYVDPTGKLVNVQYVADDNGFRVLGANNLPEARSNAPAPVSDTPEVVAARALFQKQYEEAARAAEASPDQPLSRRRRQAVLPVLLPAARTTVKVARYEPVDAAVPASTRKVELKEKEEEVLAAPVPLPLAYTVPAVPAVPKAKVHQLEAVDAAVPAATRKLEVREKEAGLVPLLPLPAARFIVL